jgi:hypothetical protein
MKDFLLEKFEAESKRDRWIEQIAADLGEKIKKFVGAGSFGWTYETKSGKILKITVDHVEIKLAYKLSKIKWWFQYVINYYNVGKTNKKVYDTESEEKQTLYYILMDKVYPVEFTDTDIGTASDIGTAIDSVYQHLIQYNVEYYNNIMDYEIVDESIEDNCGEDENIMQIARDIYPHIINIVKELKKLGIRETDFHSGNLGWANDKTKLVLYDLGGYINNSTGINIRGKLPKIKLKGKKVSEMTTKFSTFESIRDEFPGMFAPRKEKDYPKNVPGFESGTIDPEDEVPYNDGVSDYESYKKFLIVTRKRNMKETDTEIIINLKRLYEDFYMSIYNSREHFRTFLKKELVGKYISKGFEDIVHDIKCEGIIDSVHIMFDDYSAFVNFTLKGQAFSEYASCKNKIVIDKIKSEANKYNL